MKAVVRHTRRSALRRRLMQTWVQRKVNMFAQFMESERLAGRVDVNLHAIANALGVDPEVFEADLNRVSYSKLASPAGVILLNNKKNLSDHFVCAVCKEEFIGARPDEEARAECKETFGYNPANGDCALVCSVCFKRITADYPVSQFLQDEMEDAHEC